MGLTKLGRSADDTTYLDILSRALMNQEFSPGMSLANFLCSLLSTATDFDPRRARYCP